MDKLKGYDTAENLIRKINKCVGNVIPIDAKNENHLKKSFYIKTIKYIDDNLHTLLQENNIDEFKKKYSKQIVKPLSTNLNAVFKGDFFHLIEDKKHFNLIESKNYHGIPGPVRKLNNSYEQFFSKTSESNFKSLNLINLFDLSYFNNDILKIGEKEKKEINNIFHFLNNINPQETISNPNENTLLQTQIISKNSFLFIFLLFEFGYAVFFWLKNNYSLNKTIINLNNNSLKISKINIGKLLHSFKNQEITLQYVLAKNYTYLQFFSDDKELYNFSLRSNKKPNSTIINNILLKEELNISFKGNEYNEFIYNRHDVYIKKFNTTINNILLTTPNKKVVNESENKKTILDLLKDKNKDQSIKIIFPPEFNKSLLEIIQYYFLITKNKVLEYKQLQSLYYDKNKKYFIDNYLKLFDNEIELQKFILSRISQNINPSVNSYFEKNGYKKISVEYNLKFIIAI